MDNINKKMIRILSILVVILISLSISAKTVDKEMKFPVLKGPYMGQKPPGMTPEIFAPGIISTGKGELNIIISPMEMKYIFPGHCILIQQQF